MTSSSQFIAWENHDKDEIDTVLRAMWKAIEPLVYLSFDTRDIRVELWNTVFNRCITIFALRPRLFRSKFLKSMKVRSHSDVPDTTLAQIGMQSAAVIGRFSPKHRDELILLILSKLVVDLSIIEAGARLYCSDKGVLDLTLPLHDFGGWYGPGPQQKQPRESWQKGIVKGAIDTITAAFSTEIQKEAETVESENIPPAKVAPLEMLGVFDNYCELQELGKFLKTYKEEQILAFIEAFPFSTLQLDSDSIQKDFRHSTRFEMLLYLARILLRYDTFLASPDWKNVLPPTLNASELFEQLMSQLIPFLEKQTDVNISMVHRTRLYDFAMDLIQEDRNREAILCLEISRPSPKEDHDFWLCACYYNAGKSEHDLQMVKRGIHLLKEITSGKVQTSAAVFDKFRETDLLSKLKKLEGDLEHSESN